jgi:hypothetical protein
VPKPTSERSLAFQFLGLLIAAGLALALAFAATRYYSAPSLNGAARSNSWLELDFCLAAASSLVALGIGLLAGRARALDALPARALIWFALTVLFAVAWGNSLSLLTLLIAPSHACACLRLAGLGRAWRSERLWRR